MVTLQAFNGATALTALLLAAVITERNRTHAEINRLCGRLTDIVEAMSDHPVTDHWLTSDDPDDADGRADER
jgi:hypothetical protein